MSDHRPLAIDTLNEQAQELYDAINDKEPLPCVLISVAYIEQCLGSLLHAYLIEGKNTDELFRLGGGLLDSFGSRARFAFALGIIEELLFDNIMLLAKIRNRFAHSHSKIDFTDSKVAKHCQKFRFPIVDLVMVPGDPADPVPAEFWKSFDHKSQFCQMVSLAANSLIMTGLGLARCKPAHGYWTPRPSN